MKKALLATLIGAAFMGSAAAADYDFTYADGEVGFYGYQKKETYDIAIFLPGATFEGMKVKSVSVPVYAEKGIANYKNPKVWLSSELLLEKKKNAPNIASYDANLEMSGENVATLSFTLPENYTVTADGVYVGYSIEVEKNDGGTKFPMALTAGGTSGSFFLHTSASVKSWKDMAASDHRSSAMVVTVEADNLAAQNVSISSVPEDIYMSLNEPKTAEAILVTTASEPVESVDFDITIGGKVTSCHYVLPEAVPAAIDKTFVAEFEIPAQDSLMDDSVEIRVSKVNGKNNMSQNASSTLNVKVLKVVPIHQALMEEFTSTGCPWCTRGFAALEYMSKEYPEFVCVSYHTNYGKNDPMTVTSSFPCTVSGYPNAALDRTQVDLDPYYGTKVYTNLPVPIVGDILSINSQLTPWIIEVNHVWDNDNTLTANVDITNIFGFDGGRFKVGYLLVSDGLSGEESGWTQGNNYASLAPQFVPELNQFCSGGIYGKSSVSGLVFNDVVISADGYKGVNESIPSSMAADETVSHSKTWDLTKIKSELIPDKNKLRIVAFVLDAKGKVLNSAKQDVNDYTGASVNNVNVDDNAPVEYYNLNGMKVSNPQGGIFIRRQGTTTEKVILK